MILWLPKKCRIVIGALGEHRFEPGHYVYAGSAFASGGLRARLLRHCTGGRHHWHIDHLRARSELVQIWWTSDACPRERHWAQSLAGWLGDAPVSGFGASDSPLRSHLFFARARPRFETFRRRVLSSHTSHAALHCTVLSD